MRTHEIPVDQWEPFLWQFSEVNQGVTVTVERLSKEYGEQTIAAHLPLIGLNPDHSTGQERIQISAGDDVDAHVSHSVLHPSHVRLAHEEAGQPVALQIESADGSVTLVRFERDARLPPGMELA